MKTPKIRLDIALVVRGVADSRTRAQALIMAGQVSADGKILDKPGMLIEETADLHIKIQSRYVSRAGEKLASAARLLGVQFKDAIIVDVGSSTGGFTDYALQHGAKHVYCVDVGTGQLSYKLRQDERVTVMEQTDIRVAKLPTLVDGAVIDVSFISLTRILESVRALVKPDGWVVAMAKPQFEAGRPLADKYKGVIPVGAERDRILADLREWMGENWNIGTEADSLLAGAEGNVEHFFYLTPKR